MAAAHLDRLHDGSRLRGSRSTLRALLCLVIAATSAGCANLHLTEPNGDPDNGVVPWSGIGGSGHGGGGRG